ncbi:unnamed protein product [Adineta steineri]|uniref:Uncharacterized protein n=1 Tax=Adineta steineri TaxID=433720 RepID=A0A814CNH2_9BILA|nr:unnamed protein product [Adineta steineri]CAF3985376.1 unnamed protein product [Adineta steineri]
MTLYTDLLTNEINRFESEQEELKLRNELMNKVTCVISKLNIFEDKISLGYPLLIKRGSKRHDCKPIKVLNALITLNE